jgi:hypothetical protein
MNINEHYRDLLTTGHSEWRLSFVICYHTLIIDTVKGLCRAVEIDIS